MTGIAGFEIIRMVTGEAPLHIGLQQSFLRCQWQRMRLVAVCTFGSAFGVFPVVGHIPVRVDLVATFASEGLRCSCEFIERTVATQAGILGVGFV
jgi:hypothetical protein